MKIAETLPWSFTGAFKSVDGDYYIGSIVSEKAGAIIELSHGGYSDSEAKLNAAGRFIVECVNATKGTGG